MLNFQEETQRIKELELELGQSKRAVKTEREALEAAEARLESCRRAQEIVQHIAQAVQQQTHKRLSEVVSNCLSAVFDDPYTFKIDFEQKRGRTEARLRFMRKGLEVDPMTASGGGMIDVAAFALRAACLVLHRPRLSRLLVLDEPFKFVSAQYRANVQEMLERLSEELKVQIIMVTHIEELETGKIIEL